MRVTVFGVGYVGLVQAAVLAELGNHVVCIDTNQQKIEQLNQGYVPLYEPGLEVLVQTNHKAGRLQFSTDAELGVQHAEVIFIAVGTPQTEDGAADLQYVLAVAQTIGQQLQRYLVVVNKSTVPVGTADKVEAVIANQLRKRAVNIEFDVVSNPEFLKEGAAVSDCSRPDRIILGTKSDKALGVMKALYSPFNRNHERTIVMDRRSAELTKYAANCMLATKISFMNEMSNLAENLGADIEMVRRGMGSDPRIGYHFIYPGCGYGGSCFPKDVKALLNSTLESGYQASMLHAVEQVNIRQKHKLPLMLSRYFQGKLQGKTFAIWGLAFKPNTDDMRDAPSLTVIRQLQAQGAKIKAYDPIANGTASIILEEADELEFCNDPYASLTGADALVICTEWKEFKAPDFCRIKQLLKRPVIFDGRNLYEPDAMQQSGIEYYAIGRGLSVKQIPEGN